MPLFLLALTRKAGAEPWPLQYRDAPNIVGAKALPLPSDPIGPCTLKVTGLTIRVQH
jgi:hypothetical protein